MLLDAAPSTQQRHRGIRRRLLTENSKFRKKRGKAAQEKDKFGVRLTFEDHFFVELIDLRSLSKVSCFERKRFCAKDKFVQLQ